MPQELEVVLKRITTRDILELALGSQGRFFMRYRDGPLIKQGVDLRTPIGEVWASAKEVVFGVLSAKVSKQISSHISGFQGEIIEASFGREGEMWAIVKQNGTERQLSIQIRPKALEILNPGGSENKGAKRATFVALGCAEDNFVVKIDGQASFRGHAGVRGEHKNLKKKQKQKITSINNTAIVSDERDLQSVNSYIFTP